MRTLRDTYRNRVQDILGFTTLTLALLSVLSLGGNNPLVWSLLSVAVFLIFCAQVILSLTGSVPLAVRRLVTPAVLFLIVAGWGWAQSVSGIDERFSHPLWSYVPEAPAAISADPGQTRQAVLRLLCYGMIFTVTTWSCVNAQRATRFLVLIAVFSTLLAGYALYAFASGQNYFLGEASPSSVVTATFVNRNNYATYAAFGLLANMAAFLHVSQRQPDQLRRNLEGFFSGAWVFVFGTMLCIGAITLTQSRAGGLASLAGVSVFLFAWRRGKVSQWEKVMFVLFMVVLLGLIFTSAAGLQSRLLATNSEEARFSLYPAVMAAIADRPILGHGLGAFQDAFRVYVPETVSDLEWRRAHSTYLEIAFGLGLPAAMALFSAIGLIVARLVRGSRTRRQNRAFSCFALGCVATAAFHSLVEFSLQMPAVAALFSAILGLAYAQSFTRAETDPSKKRSQISRTGAVTNEVGAAF